jgi:hypothetical protein
MPEYIPISFQQRVNYAAVCIINQHTRSREFDSCFEMYDGDLVVAALVRRAKHSAELYAAIAKWQSHGRSSELPATWLEAAAKYKAVPNLARKARGIRKSREKETDRMLRAAQREEESDDQLISGLRTFATKINNARFFIALEGDGISSGFYAEAQTRKAARVEADNHLRNFPAWQKAIVRRAHQ